MAMEFAVHFKSKGRAKLFSGAPNGVKEDSEGYDTVEEAIGVFGALMLEEEKEQFTRLHPCPGCRRAFK